MAFPTTGLLDDFNRANEDPITTNWTTGLIPGEAGAMNLSDQMVGLRAANGWYDLATFGPNCEAWMTLVDLPTLNNSDVKLYARMQNPGQANVTGYWVGLRNHLGTQTIRFIRVTSSTTDVLIGSDITGFTDWAAGDGFGFSVIGDELSVYRRAGAIGNSWTFVDSVTDANIATAGYIGLGKLPQDIQQDDFGGGTVVMGITFLRLTGPAQLSGSATTLYTCPTGKVARILHIHASNPSAGDVDLNVSIGTDAAATRIYDDFPLAADSVTDDSTDYTLAAGEVIQGWASSAGVVVLTITGYEDSA